MQDTFIKVLIGSSIFAMGMLVSKELTRGDFLFAGAYLFCAVIAHIGESYMVVEPVGVPIVGEDNE